MLRISVCAEPRASKRICSLLSAGGSGDQRVYPENDFEACRAALKTGQHDVYFVAWPKPSQMWTLLDEAASGGSEARVVAILDTLDLEREAEALQRGAADVLILEELGPGVLQRAVRRLLARRSRDPADGSELDLGGAGGSIRALRDALMRATAENSAFAVLSLGVEQLSPRATVFEDQNAALSDFERLLSGLLDDDVRLFRLGSRFIALLENPASGPTVARTADRILERMDAPAVIAGRTLEPTVSIGIALSPDDGTEAGEVLRGAKVAMQTARAAGGRVFRFRSHAPNHQASRRLALQRGLAGALERREFALAYQPQIDLENELLVGAEALLRWQSPELGPVPPSEFIPVLEQSGHITEVGEWALREACRQAQVWNCDNRPICVSVNVSARQFEKVNIEDLVRDALAESRLPPALLGLELTEGLLLESTADIRDALASLRQLGVKIAVDDFGTGYASLSYVKRFPMSAIKIDREFVRGLPIDAENVAITSSILALAHSLAFEVIAEGVETEGEQEFLRSLHCDVVQGFLHARPMHVPDFEQWRDAYFGDRSARGGALRSRPPPPPEAQ